VEPRPGQPVEPRRDIGLDDYRCIGHALLTVSPIRAPTVDRRLIAEQIDGIRVGRKEKLGEPHKARL
jgi:hypothetical protein